MIRTCLSLLLPVLLLIGCTAPSASPESPGKPETPPMSKPLPAEPAPPATPEPATPPTAEPAPGANAPVVGASPADLSRACKTDADCAVKDVGNCCGAYPMCVNKDAKTNPEAVRAQCAKDGMASICGFQEVSGCQCVKGQCENIKSGEGVVM